MPLPDAAWVESRSSQRSDTPVGWAARGDQSAWNQLVRRHSPLLWRVARGNRLSPEDAADAVQVTWLRLAEHLHQIRNPDRISSWLLTTLRRECLRQCAHRRATQSLEDIDLRADERQQPEAVAEYTDQRLLLLAAFNRLPAWHRVLLAALLGDPPPSYADVARQLGMPLGSIGPTRRRALSRLRREIAAPPAGSRDRP